MCVCSVYVYLLNVYLDVLLQVVPVEVKNEIMNEIKSITDDYERQLVSELSIL